MLVLALAVAAARAAGPLRAADPACLTPADRQAMLAVVRRAAGGEALGFDPDTMPAKLLLSTNEAVIVSAHRAGQAPLVAAVGAGDLFGQLCDAAARLRETKRLGELGSLRFKIDVVLRRQAAGPDPALGLGRPPVLGIEGLHLRLPGDDLWLPASEALRLGLRDGEAFVWHALKRAGGTLEGAAPERFTAGSFIERGPGGAGAPVDLYRGMPLVARVSRRGLLAAVGAGGEWLLRFQRPDGSFHYRYHAATDGVVGKGYNAVRHAGAAWGLVLAGRATGERRFLDGARRALDWVVGHARSRGEMAWVEHGGRRRLGAAALAVVGLLDYRAAAGTEALDGHVRRLGRFLLFMQRDDGFFDIEYEAGKHRGVWPEGSLGLYAPGEAMLALTRLAREWPEGPWRSAAVRAADFAVRGRDGWYAGRGLEAVVPDAWTMMALDELHAQGAARRPHVDYCFLLARLALDEQVAAGASHWVDHVGAPRSTGAPPSVGPAACRCEGLLAAWRLGRRMGVATEPYREAVVLSVRFQLRHQFDGVNSYLLPNPARARGGFYASYADPTVRIDSVQHAIAALAGAAALLEADEER